MPSMELATFSTSPGAHGFGRRERTVFNSLDRGGAMADQDHAAQAQKNRATLGVARKLGLYLAHLLFNEQRGDLGAKPKT